MTNHSVIERMVAIMPHYHNSKNEIFGNIVVIPNEWFRRAFCSVSEHLRQVKGNT
jgi:hypothetical protein